MQQNQGILRGRLKNNWVFDYEIEGESFYRNTLLVDRLSKIQDEIPLVVSDKHLEELDYIPGSGFITLEGSFRSRNKLVNGKPTLQLYFFVERVGGEIPQYTNSIGLEGYICKKPVHRLTPLGREICDLLVAVNRNTGRSDYIPCIAWGRNADWLKNLSVGTFLKIEGRIQSRKFSKQGDTVPDTHTAYEVSIAKVSKGE